MRRGQLLLVADIPDTDETSFTWDGDMLTRLVDCQLGSSPVVTGDWRAHSSGGHWARRIVCAGLGLTLGWAIWSVATDTRRSAATSASRPPASAIGPRHAHPLLVEPTARGPASGGER